MISRHIMQALLCLMLALAVASCGSDSDESYRPQSLKSTDPGPLAKASIRYAIYIENSASLDGYLKAGGDSSFKANVYDLITFIATADDKKSISFFDANTKIISVHADANAEQAGDYIDHLDSETFRERANANGAKQSESDLQQVFRFILDSLRTGNEVHILITDGIFSPGEKKNASQFFRGQEAGIKLLFDDHKKHYPFATLVLQFCSDFEGNYFDQENKGKPGRYRNRPYYAICMGNEQALQRLLDRVQGQQAFPGFRNFLFLTARERYPVKARIVNFRDHYQYNADQPMTVSGLRTGGKDKQYRIKLDLKLDDLPVGEAYLLDVANYTASQDFRVESVKAQSGHPGHYELALAAPGAAPGTVSLSLKNRLPAWIDSSHIDTDKGRDAIALSGKTLGIRNILGGIYGAYYGQQPDPGYFSLTIFIKE